MFSIITPPSYNLYLYILYLIYYIRKIIVGMFILIVGSSLFYLFFHKFVFKKYKLVSIIIAFLLSCIILLVTDRTLYH